MNAARRAKRWKRKLMCSQMLGFLIEGMVQRAQHEDTLSQDRELLHKDWPGNELTRLKKGKEDPLETNNLKAVIIISSREEITKGRQKGRIASRLPASKRLARQNKLEAGRMYVLKTCNQIMEEEGTSSNECSRVVIVSLIEETEDKEDAVYRANIRANGSHYAEANLKLIGVSTGETLDRRIMELAWRPDILGVDFFVP